MTFRSKIPKIIDTLLQNNSHSNQTNYSLEQIHPKGWINMCDLFVGFTLHVKWERIPALDLINYIFADRYITSSEYLMDKTIIIYIYIYFYE